MLQALIRDHYALATSQRESGTIGSTPAVQNAVVDAVAHLGVRHIDMPLTPERVWRAIQAREVHQPYPAAEAT